MSAPYTYAGIDWSSGGWIVVGYGNDTFSTRTYDSLEQFWDDHDEDCERAVVDVPLGLCESRESDDCPCPNDGTEDDEEIARACDIEARKCVGPMYRLVFTAPARGAAELVEEEKDHATVSEKNRDLTGKGLSSQAKSICKGIVEARALLTHDEGPDTTTLVEGHPEVCFAAFAGNKFEHTKRTAPGVAKRLDALAAVPEYEEGDWLDLAKRLDDPDRKVGLDDLLDALALALTACAPDSELARLPDDTAEPPLDTTGIPMAIRYRELSA
jgi:predicted RNase H-like nuclease